MLLMRVVLLLLLICHQRRHESSLLSQLVPVRLQAVVGCIKSAGHHRCLIVQYLSFVLRGTVFGSLVLDVELVARLIMRIAACDLSLLFHLKSILHCGVQ